MKVHTIQLTELERACLVQVRDLDRRPYLREKAAALLKIADGMNAHAVARQGLLRPRQPDTVYRWLADWERTRTLTPQPCRRARLFPPEC